MQTKRGFTLVEVLVVVTVLGILAAIAIPQYRSGSNEAQMTCLQSNLHAIRKQIELYKIHHNGVLPAAAGENGDDFVRRMTTKTDPSGAAGGPLGPYLERMPANAFNQSNTVRVGGQAAGANTHGWRYDPLTNVFQSDDNDAPDHINL